MRAPTRLLALPLAVLCAAAGSGCGSGQSPEDGVRDLWSAMQRGVRLSTDRESIVAAGGKQIICYSMAPSLTRSLAAQAGAVTPFLPRCLFLRRVPLLDGTTKLGDLRDVQVSRRGKIVTATFTATTHGRSRPLRVTFGHLNASNWAVASIDGLRAIPPGRPLHPEG